jgi:hypothetical protein
MGRRLRPTPDGAPPSTTNFGCGRDGRRYYRRAGRSAAKDHNSPWVNDHEKRGQGGGHLDGNGANGVLDASARARRDVCRIEPRRPAIARAQVLRARIPERSCKNGKSRARVFYDEPPYCIVFSCREEPRGASAFSSRSSAIRALAAALPLQTRLHTAKATWSGRSSVRTSALRAMQVRHSPSR